MKLHFRNTDIYYTAKGTGNPLVLLHGFLESSKIWEPFMEGLAKKRQVICIDLPGHGKTGIIEEVHSMELMAQVVKGVLDHLGIDKATFVGHSMGGYVSLAFLELDPQSTAGLVLMNSTPEEDTAEKRINRDRSVAVVERNKKAYITTAISGLVTPANNLRFKAELANLRSIANTFPTEGITAALKGMKIRTNKREVLTNFKNFKAIISGKNDPIIPYDSIEKLVKECNCQFISMPDGHLSYLENYSEIDKFVHFID
ncbi:alpha/beta hydrolase [Antarcticibacterium arcticum]|uniref:Alpha/beta hydrolase n=1 Tax=Antarcticibacterium arcticum TaxID=2585771 RepID=A0A5B8YNB1_9FLAO|nr:alpha/beta hydrolase [Antarcticibacterium arcticum]QED38327.1 alpha/beta hydrolase [Antarcticibacterium arcticum]